MLSTNIDSDEFRKLKSEVENTLILYESYISTSAARTRQMIERKGLIKTIEDLVQTSDYQQGFRKLHEHNKLDRSFEALVLKYKDFFSDNAIQFANYRLQNPDILKNI